MHELLLFASVPSHQHHELRQQLAGLTAMQPRHRLERHLIFKAYRKPGVVTTRVGASQDVQGVDLQRLNKMLNGGMYYTQVVGSVSEADFGGGDGGGKPDDGQEIIGGENNNIEGDINQAGIMQPQQHDRHQSPYDYDHQSWKLEFRDIPEAGTRSAVTARLMASASLPRGDIIEPMNAWGYSFITEYVVEGDLFVLNDIVIFLHRVLQYPSGSEEPPHAPRRVLPEFQRMSPLDNSGSYVLQAAITVQDGSNQETMKTASQHLFGLREQLRSVVRLEQADRLSLDTRAK